MKEISNIRELKAVVTSCVDNLRIELFNLCFYSTLTNLLLDFFFLNESTESIKRAQCLKNVKIPLQLAKFFVILAELK